MNEVLRLLQTKVLMLVSPHYLHWHLLSHLFGVNLLITSYCYLERIKILIVSYTFIIKKNLNLYLIFESLQPTSDLFLVERINFLKLHVVFFA